MLGKLLLHLIRQPTSGCHLPPPGKAMGLFAVMKKKTGGETPPLPQNCMIHRRGDSRIARFYLRFSLVFGRRQSNFASLSSKLASQKLPLPCAGRYFLKISNPLTINLSSWAESKFYRTRSEVKPRRPSAAGISKRVWVAHHSKCYIPSKSHQKSKRDPASANASRFFIAIRSEKFRLAACRLLRDDIQIFYFAIIRL